MTTRPSRPSPSPPRTGSRPCPPPPATLAPATTRVVDLLGARLRAPDYRAWRAQVEATGGCAAPDPPHRLLADPRPRRRRAARTRRRPCSPRAATAAPRSARPAPTATPPTPSTCSAPASPETTPRTSPTPSPSTRGCSSPSPRPRSGRCTPARSPAAGTSSPAAAGTATTPTTRASAPPLDPDTYDYDGRGALAGPRRRRSGHRFTTTLRRALAAALGVRAARLPRPRPAVLRQGRRVPTPRPGPLPRRHPPRRPRRTHRPTTRRARPTTRSRDAITDRRPRRHAHHQPARRDTAACSAGAPSSTCARSPRPPPRQLEDERRARSPTPRWPATSPSTPPKPPAPPRGRRPADPRRRPHRPPRRHRRTTAA